MIFLDPQKQLLMWGFFCFISNFASKQEFFFKSYIENNYICYSAAINFAVNQSIHF